MRILLTGAGGPSAISVWKSLDADHVLHMADMDPCAAGLYLVPAERRFIVPRGDAPELVPALLEICRSQHIDFLIPTVDAELAPVARAKEEFAASGVKTALPPPDCLLACRDKYVLLEKLRSVVPVPAFRLLTDASAAEARVFPYFAKPRRGAGSRGLAKIERASDFGPLPKDGSYLLQEYLPGEEYSVDVYIRGDGVAVAAVPRERLKVDSGIAIAARTVHLPLLQDQAIRAAQEIGIRYVANVQFRRGADGAFKLLEINPRFPGTLPLTAEAGVDIPKLLIADITGQSLPDSLLPFKEVMVVRYWEERFFDESEWKRLCRP